MPCLPSHWDQTKTHANGATSRIQKELITPLATSLLCGHEEGRLPRWKDGLSRAVMHGSTPSRRSEREVGKKRSGDGNPGAMTSRCGADEAPGAPDAEGSAIGGADGVSIRVAYRSDAYERTSLTGGWKLLEQGPEVRVLLGSAQVECRLSSAPPISMQLLCAGRAGLPIRVKAHCLLGAFR